MSAVYTVTAAPSGGIGADGRIEGNYGRYRELSAFFTDLSQTTLDRFSHPDVFRGRTPDHFGRDVLHGSDSMLSESAVNRSEFHLIPYFRFEFNLRILGLASSSISIGV